MLFPESLCLSELNMPLFLCSEELVREERICEGSASSREGPNKREVMFAVMWIPGGAGKDQPRDGLELLVNLGLSSLAREIPEHSE